MSNPGIDFGREHSWAIWPPIFDPGDYGPHQVAKVGLVIEIETQEIKEISPDDLPRLVDRSEAIAQDIFSVNTRVFL